MTFRQDADFADEMQAAFEAWYAYFSTGKAEHFFALMQSLQQ